MNSKIKPVSTGAEMVLKLMVGIVLIVGITAGIIASIFMPYGYLWGLGVIIGSVQLWAIAMVFVNTSRRLNNIENILLHQQFIAQQNVQYPKRNTSNTASSSTSTENNSEATSEEA